MALLFGFPDSRPMQMLRMRQGYFDLRTGETWDLFFPGYYRRGPDDPTFEDLPVRGTSDEWLFNDAGFEAIRQHVEESSAGRWDFSGNTDLVLIGGQLPEAGEPIVDWPSTLSGSVSDPEAGISTLTLSAVIERISRDLENELEDPSFGVDPVVGAEDGPVKPGTLTRDLVINVIGGIASALGAHQMGL